MPQNVVPRSVESLAAVAVILARSPSLVEVLQNTGHLDLRALSRILGRHRYMSTVADTPQGRTFSIRVISDAEPLVPAKEQSHINWIRPIVLRRFVMILTLLLALCVLIALEILYRNSEQHTGIADVDVNSLQKYAWIYTPVVVLVLLATTFNILDFELEFADPYHELARGYAGARTSLLWDPLRNVTLKTCLEAFHHSRFALVASSISVLFAPMLTIVVSGLLTTRTVTRTLDTSPSTQTWFNISSDRYADNTESRSFAIPALILQGNMSYPQWTRGELAFPSIDLSALSTGIANITNGIFEIQTLAARGSVNCTLVPDTDYNNLTVGAGQYGCEDCVQYNLSALNDCGNVGNDRGMIWTTGYTDFPSSGTGYFGKVDFSSGTTINSETNKPKVCPAYLVSFGNIENREIKKWSLYYCYSGFETVRVNATVSANLATIIDEPQVLADTAEVFADAWKPATDSLQGGPYFALINFTYTDEVFDSYFNVMVHGKDGVPRQELLQDDALIKQFTHTYRQWSAQWLNTHMRSPVSDLAKNVTNTAGTLPQTVKGVFHNPNRQRLFLTEVSTRILQGVIGVLLICGIVIFILVDMSEVLPKPVGSIGAVASLLAGSRLIDERSGLIPRGSEWLSDEEMKRRGMWEGEMFRMGWWTDDDDGKDPLFDSTYSGAEGEIDESEVYKKRGQFRIDARPKLMASQPFK